MENLSGRGKSNFESFVKHTSPTVLVNFHIKDRVGLSSSTAKAKQVRKPHIVLSDILSAYHEWSCYAVGVPLTLENDWTNPTQYYAPTLSAIQIFTKKPLVDGSSSRSFGKDCHLYLEYNQPKSFDDRPPLIETFMKLAEKYHALNSLSSSDLSEKSWFSVSWLIMRSPVCQIPAVQTVNEYFLTYHSMTPVFPETFPEEAEVELPAFGVVSSKLSGKVWIMPGTSDQENINKYEESAASWLRKLMFTHNDFDMFMDVKSNNLPFPSRLFSGEWYYDYL